MHKYRVEIKDGNKTTFVELLSESITAAIKEACKDAPKAKVIDAKRIQKGVKL